MNADVSIYRNLPNAWIVITVDLIQLMGFT